MRYNTAKNTPGEWGYRCKVCSNIAFAFVHGEPIPGEDEYLENIEVSQRGPYASLRRSEHICQHCTAKITSVGGYVVRANCVKLSTYRKALKKRLDAASNLGRSGRGNIVVDYEYMGCGWTDQEKADLIPKAVAPPLPPPVLTAAEKAAAAKQEEKEAADLAEKERIAAEHASAKAAKPKKGKGDADEIDTALSD